MGDLGIWALDGEIPRGVERRAPALKKKKKKENGTRVVEEGDY